MANTFTWNSDDECFMINSEALFDELGIKFDDEGELTYQGHHVSGDFEDVLMYVYACGTDPGGFLGLHDYAVDCNWILCDHPQLKKPEENLLAFFLDRIATLFAGHVQTFHSQPLWEKNVHLYKLFVESRYTD